ncbi:glycosyltransferase family 39 protein [Sphingobacterium corticibacter]|uniref:Glycosyl transferase n=1 Tax=Sphingobacterium corticibacter TaxID=2171749 RepID=A0A2T8HEU4_9SPHI|nr:glycosyltransferase family 39 protein [Sphingobacterium corticibacter]PVH23959.1 glycosyl transferase [Sphingobacterium corticibacter]
MRNNLILIGFILLKFIIQYTLIGSEYELQRDEFLHLDQANHLAWGYTSVPPVTSWISYLVQLLGNSVFWIKFFPTLFGALTILVVGRTIEALKGNLLALLLGAGCITFSVLFRLNILYQPNSLDVLCWTASYFFFIKYLQHHQGKWLYALAVTFAIGFLNKYNIAFLLLGILPAIIASRDWKIFTDRRLYYSAAIAFVLILPNLIWQYTHEFPVFQHMKELAETHLVHVNRWNFMRSQFLFFPATFPIILVGLYALMRYVPFRKYRSLFCSFIFTLIIFLFFRAKDYYAIGLYPIYFAFGSVYISSLLSSRVGRLIQISLIVLAAVCFLPIYDVAFPNKSPEYIVHNPEKYSRFGLLTWEDGKEHSLPQDFADMLGWKELASKVDSIYSIIPNASNSLILCDNYGQAGAINYYSELGIRAVSFNADYLYWFDFSTPYYNYIRVKSGWEAKEELEKTAPYFEQSIEVGSVTNVHSREFGTTILCFIDAKIDLNQQIKKEVEEHKRR